jgi:hypothetical protein
LPEKRKIDMKMQILTTKGMMALGLGIVLALFAHTEELSLHAAQLRDYDSLPDWSGVWAREGGAAFDRSTWTMNGEPANPSLRSQGVNAIGTRAHPPYNEEWEALYQSHVELRDQGRFPDPLTRCIAHGFPRILNATWPVEFVVRPEQVWILAEHTRSTMRIYTDGRPQEEVVWPNLIGDSVGHWEGDTLVFTTVGFKGWRDKDSILDRSGLVLSDAAHATTRIHRTREEDEQGVLRDLLLVEITLEDPQALTEPWVVEKRFWKQPEGTRIYDYECNENNRTVVGEDGQSLFVGADGEVIP